MAMTPRAHRRQAASPLVADAFNRLRSISRRRNPHRQPSTTQRKHSVSNCPRGVQYRITRRAHVNSNSARIRRYDTKLSRIHHRRPQPTNHRRRSINQSNMLHSIHNTHIARNRHNILQLTNRRRPRQAPSHRTTTSRSRVPSNSKSIMTTRRLRSPPQHTQRQHQLVRRRSTRTRQIRTINVLNQVSHDRHDTLISTNKRQRLRSMTNTHKITIRVHRDNRRLLLNHNIKRISPSQLSTSLHTITILSNRMHPTTKIIASRSDSRPKYSPPTPRHKRTLHRLHPCHHHHHLTIRSRHYRKPVLTSTFYTAEEPR